LDDLEARVDKGNQTIAAAAANYEAARALVREARAQYFPTLTTSPAITNSRVSTTAIPGITSKGYTDTMYSLPFTASWEPDLWGRIQNTVRTTLDAAQGSEADLENARLLTHANLAADYFQLRDRQTTLAAFGQVEDNLAALRILAQDLQQQNLAVQSAQRYVRLATARNMNGLDPYLNVLTAQVNLLTYQETYITFQTQQTLDSVQLIEALGGGWDAQLPTPRDVGGKMSPRIP
jgi:outer membrane protein TolC